MPTDEQKHDEEKPLVPKLPVPVPIVPQPQQRVQPNHPTGKIQTQLEQIWAQVQNIDRIGKGNDFILKTLVGFGMLDFNPEKNQFEQFKQKPMIYRDLVKGLMAMQKEIAEIKTDIQFMKKTIMNSVVVPMNQAPVRQIIETPEEREIKICGSDKTITIEPPKPAGDEKK
jgi:hypothetical protein